MSENVVFAGAYIMQDPSGDGIRQEVVEFIATYPAGHVLFAICIIGSTIVVYPLGHVVAGEAARNDNGITISDSIIINCFFIIFSGLVG